LQTYFDNKILRKHDKLEKRGEKRSEEIEV
jgi:hypothetical protein